MNVLERTVPNNQRLAVAAVVRSPRIGLVRVGRSFWEESLVRRSSRTVEKTRERSAGSNSIQTTSLYAGLAQPAQTSDQSRRTDRHRGNYQQEARKG